MFRFTIRDVLWLKIVAVGLGRGLEHWRRMEPIANVLRMVANKLQSDSHTEARRYWGKPM
jgi:hypothetical protein